jgi:RNA polymerase sigma factor, sigma-70 family
MQYKSNLKSIYEEYADSLYSYGCKFTDDKELIKDCMHDVFVRLYEKGDISFIRDVKFYLLRSLKNELIRELSKNKEFSFEDMTFSIPSSGSTDRNILEDEETTYMKELINKALSCLTNRQKEAIYLYYIEELDYDNICRLMNMNYQSIRNLIHRGISRLRERLDPKDLVALYAFCLILSSSASSGLFFNVDDRNNKFEYHREINIQIAG